MQRPGPPAAASFLLAIALAGTAGSQQGTPTVLRSRPFTVHLHFHDPVLAERARRIVDLVWEIIRRDLSPAGVVGQRRLHLHLYRDPARYAAVARHHGERPIEGQEGFADPATLTAHGLLQASPWWDGRGMDPRTRQLIAHEAAHLALFACIPTPSDQQPEWLTEGLPQWIEGEVSRLGGWIDNRESDPYEGGSVRVAQRLLAEGRLPGVQAILDDAIAGAEPRRRYAASRMFVLMLKERYPAATAVLLRLAARTPAHPGFTELLADTLWQQLGPRERATLQTTFECFIRDRRVASPTPRTPAAARGEPGRPTYVPGAPRLRWRGSVTKPSATFEATLTLQSGQPPQADLVLGGQSDGSRLRVSLVAGAGVYLTARSPDPRAPWSVLAAATSVSVEPDQPGRLRVVARTDHLRVSWNGVDVLVCKTGDRPPTGAWGTGSPPGARASWSALRQH